MSRRNPPTLHSLHAGHAWSPLLVLTASVSLALVLIGTSLSLAGPLAAWAEASRVGTGPQPGLTRGTGTSHKDPVLAQALVPGRDTATPPGAQWDVLRDDRR